MAKFQLGRPVATPGALAAMANTGESPAKFLALHVSGDWGVMSADDKRANERALEDGSRIFSAYLLADQTKIWVITEATDDAGSRGSTCILLPEEY